MGFARLNKRLSRAQEDFLGDGVGGEVDGQHDAGGEVRGLEGGEVGADAPEVACAGVDEAEARGPVPAG